MPEQKLKTTDEWYEIWLKTYGTHLSDFDTFVNRIVNETLEVAAQECDNYASILELQTTEPLEDAIEASKVLAGTIRSLIQKEGEPDAQKNQS